MVNFLSARTVGLAALFGAWLGVNFWPRVFTSGEAIRATGVVRADPVGIGPIARTVHSHPRLVLPTLHPVIAPTPDAPMGRAVADGDLFVMPAGPTPAHAIARFEPTVDATWSGSWILVAP